ncbi:hypothetical protein BDQ17DRAFT_1547530 [Cyathus striatus]|nr:hypothetical protein BDQ17DRAFT_1547530 [Cyathus striatus]
MPAKTTLFEKRVRMLHDFGSAPHNFIAFNPQGRLIALAGFGNLAGRMDVVDWMTVTKGSGGRRVRGGMGKVIAAHATPGVDGALDAVAKKMRNLNEVCFSFWFWYVLHFGSFCVTSFVFDPLPAAVVLSHPCLLCDATSFHVPPFPFASEKLKCRERLEATQLKKIEGEAEIKKELASLGSSEDPSLPPFFELSFTSAIAPSTPSILSHRVTFVFIFRC